jgi:hypothetical protein
VPEVTQNYIRIPVKDKVKNNSIVIISISRSKGITALYDTKRKVVVTYLFARAKGWTMTSAKVWISGDSRKFEVIDFSKIDK